MCSIGADVRLHALDSGSGNSGLVVDTGVSGNTDTGFVSSLKIAGKAPFAAGSLQLAIPVPEGSASQSPPEIASWALGIFPVQDLSIFAGSVSSTDLITRARSPSFSILSLFTQAPRIGGAPLLSSGSTGKTGNIAFEFTPAFLRFAGSISAPNWPDGGEERVFRTESGWILAGILPGMDAGCGRKPSFACSVLTGFRELEKEDDDAWFQDEIPAGDTTLLFTAAEISTCGKRFSSRSTFFGNAGNLIQPALAARSELSLSIGPCALNAGFFGADGRFRDLDGDLLDVIAQMYLSPQFVRPFSDRSDSFFRWGGILQAVRRRNTLWYENAITDLSGGSGMEITSVRSSISARAMYDEGTWSASLRARKRGFLHRSITAETAYSVDLLPAGEAGDSSISCRVSWKAGAPFRVEASGIGNFRRPGDGGEDTDGTLSLSASFSPANRNSSLSFIAKIEVCVPERKTAGEVRLSLRLP